MRGGIGEVQLSMLLESILAPEQYESNVKTKSTGRDFVEFAVKLPGKDDTRKHIWLPVDAKFPKEYYESLQSAYDSGDLNIIEREQRNLENAIRVMAKDISSKYIEPPGTTDFAIMFLPFEGIYAEVVRKASLLEEIQSRYKILITGPTTFAAILNSLQMGFRTLAIEKRSGEVWSILGAVKREFSTFGDLLNKAQKSIQGGLDDIDKLVGVRTRVIQKRLRNVESMNPANETDKERDSGLIGAESESDAGYDDE
jgi:DNA recombination protein RmuC